MSIAVAGLERASAFAAREGRLLIDGQWTSAERNATIDVENPANGQILSIAARASRIDVDRAVQAARSAFDRGLWRGFKPAQRAAILWRIGELIEENADELAVLESLDSGKPVSAALASDIPGSAKCFKYYAGWAWNVTGKTLPSSAPGDHHAYTLREPVGVAGLIVPWNYPLLMASWKIAPALAAACACVLKPAEQTPLTALRLGELLLEAGVPAGVVNIVSGYGDEAGAALAEHPDVDKIAFTGSTQVGREILRAAAGNMKKVTLELGGKSPTIVMADADLDQAAEGAARAIFTNSGQVCVAGSRLFVAAEIYDALLERVARIASETRLLPGTDPESQMGPLVSAKQLGRVSELVQSASSEGARILTGGKRRGSDGYFYEPTVIVEAKPDMRVYREEVFGPVVTAIKVENSSDLVRLANDTIYGLAAYVWTSSLKNAHNIAEGIRAGSVYINSSGAADITFPFGGYKQSGWGREKGEGAIDLYSETKMIIATLI